VTLQRQRVVHVSYRVRTCLILRTNDVKLTFDDNIVDFVYEHVCGFEPDNVCDTFQQQQRISNVISCVGTSQNFHCCKFGIHCVHDILASTTVSMAVVMFGLQCLM
jgi:hypothetical protein